MCRSTVPFRIHGKLRILAGDVALGQIFLTLTGETRAVSYHQGKMLRLIEKQMIRSIQFYAMVMSLMSLQIAMRSYNNSGASRDFYELLGMPLWRLNSGYLGATPSTSGSMLFVSTRTLWLNGLLRSASWIVSTDRLRTSSYGLDCRMS
jgi:hypothetical protein